MSVAMSTEDSPGVNDFFDGSVTSDRDRISEYTLRSMVEESGIFPE